MPYRTVSFQTKEPYMFIMCDNNTCGATATCKPDMTSEETFKKSQASFLSQLRKDGWLVSLGEIHCPEHVRIMQTVMQQVAEAHQRQALQAGKGLVTVATGAGDVERAKKQAAELKKISGGE